MTSHQVSERTAFFLKRKSGEQEVLYGEMREHYKLRSTIAHGGTSTRANRELTQQFGKLLLIVHSALLKVLGDTKVTSIFESARGNQFNRALKNLVSRGKVELDDGE